MPSSRFLLWDEPNAYPQYDIINRDTAGPVFDLGVDLDDYNGSIYLRAEHIIEMARDLGMATTEEVQELLAINRKLEDQINVLPKAQEELKNGLDSLVSNFYNHLHNGEPAVPLHIEKPEPVEPKVTEPVGESKPAFSL